MYIVLPTTTTRINNKHSSERNSKQSPLLRLPRELRDIIWDHALRGYQIKVYSNTYSAAGTTPCIPPEFHLLLVCRQIHSEIHPRHYSLGTFFFAAAHDLRNYGDRNRLHHIQALETCAPYWWVESPTECAVYFPLEKMPALKSMHVSVLSVWDDVWETNHQYLRAHLQNIKFTLYRSSLSIYTREKVWHRNGKDNEEEFESWHINKFNQRPGIDCTNGSY